MGEDDIKNNPSLKKLRDNTEQYRNLARVWPLFRPFAKLLGVDTKSVDDNLGKIVNLYPQVDDMTSIPDKFNSLFSPIGWIMFESMELDAAKGAIAIAETDGIDAADDFLVNHFSPTWIESHINRLKHIKGFKERFNLAKLALEDYKAGRFYGSIFITLSLIDGWVSELNIIDFQRRGFFSEASQLVAWDSIAAHPKGLPVLQKLFGKSRLVTRTDEIKIPYRHGIMHGMDLGYNNKYVAAKCWAALFAVRDWVIKFLKNEISPPKLEPQVERTLWESIERYKKVQEELEQLKRWQPREILVGVTIPAYGNEVDYPDNSPEQKIVEFLNYWKSKNYGFMARCISPIASMKPHEIREVFDGNRLLQYELLAVEEITTTVANIRVRTEFENETSNKTSTYEFRLVCSDQAQKLAYTVTENSTWGVATWRLEG